MVECERLRRLTADIREALAAARPLAERRFEELGLYERLALRYLLVELVEAAATLCLYALRELYGGDADGYPSCFLELARLGVIPQRVAEELARAARLRNLLVHRYWVIDDRRLHREAARGLRVFEEYAALMLEVVGCEA